MNIFYLDRDLDSCVAFHADKHVVKMCIEYAQLLCTAIHIGDPSKVQDWMYKSTHKNHPDAVWARQSKDHWIYLRDLAVGLGDEYYHRYGIDKNKRHRSIEEVVKQLPVPDLPNKGWMDPPQCVSDTCLSDDVVDAYRKYYVAAKTDLASWTKRDVPEWWAEYSK